MATWFQEKLKFPHSLSRQRSPSSLKWKGSPMGLSAGGHCCSLLVLREELTGSERKPDAAILKYLDYVN